MELLKENRKKALFIRCGYCTRCGVCVEMCPTQALEFCGSSEALKISLKSTEKCTLCGLCELYCPHLAVFTIMRGSKDG